MEFPNNLAQNLTNEGASKLKDALLALTALNQDTVLLDYDNVIIRRGYRDLKCVRLFSGGVAGNDICHAFLVGKGMLTAAIVGDGVAPTSRQILRTIKELNQGENHGIFVISRVGSRVCSEVFSFGLAVERANADCQMRVKLLPVDDNKDNGEHYTCGFVLLAKILGAMAERGAFYDEILRCYESIVEGIASVQLNYSTAETNDEVRLSKDFDSKFRSLLDGKSRSCLQLHHSIPAVALINTSKHLEKISELSIVKQVIERLRQMGVSMARLYSGSFVSGPPNTASLTVMKVYDNKIIEYLDAPTEAPGWRPVKQFLPEITLYNEIPGLLVNQGKQQVPLKGPHLSDSQSNILVKSVQFACEALISCERQLNIIDSEKSAGNIGSRFRNLSEHVKNRLSKKRMPIACPYAFLKKISVMAESAIGGTMGSIYGVLFEAAAGVFERAPDDAPVAPELWIEALSAAEKAVAKYSSEDFNNRTMYGAIKACARALETNAELCFIDRYALGVSKAEEAAAMTRLPANKHPDAGAHAVGIWMRAVFEGVKLLCLGDVVPHVVQ